MSEVAGRLQIDLGSARRVLVGGTNGKGSTVAALEALGRAHGLSVACYTSPHLRRFNERMRVDGEPLDDDTIARCLDAVEAARGDTPLTYFEHTTLAALYGFGRFAPHWCLLEVGLGGRLDAVNIVEPDVAVVTNVQLDHQEWLGQDRETIAREKAGIFRAGVPAVCAERSPPGALRNGAGDVGARWIQAGRDFFWQQGPGGAWHWRGVDRMDAPLEVVGGSAPVLESSAVAAALQVAALLLEQPSPALMAEAVCRARLQGRCQVVWHGDRELVLDVAHNPAATRRLEEFLRERPGTGRTHVILAVLDDKDAAGMGEALGQAVNGRWFFPRLEVARARRAEELARLLGVVDGVVCEHPAAALDAALKAADPGDRVVVTGSFYTVGSIMDVLSERGTEVE